MRPLIVALLLVATACGSSTESADAPSDAESGTETTTVESGGPDSEDGDAGSETTSDGTQLFVASGFGVDIVDLDAETQEVFAEGYEYPYGLIVMESDLWFADAQNSLVAVDAVSGEERGATALPGQFNSLAFSDDAVWVIAGLVGLDSQLVGIERSGMAIRGAALPPENTYYDVVAGSGSDVWVHGGYAESLTTVRRVDPGTVTVGDPVESGVIAHSMVIGFDALWIGGTKPGTPDGLTAPLAAISKLDASTGEALDLFEIGGQGGDSVVVEVAFGHLWATQSLESVLVKFDPASGKELGRVSVGSGAGAIPYPILVTADAIWVVNSTDNQALSFDPDTLEFVSGINLPTFAGAFTFVP